MIMRAPLHIEWIQMSNKYLEHLNKYTYDKWKKATVIEKKEDSGFEKEFDFVIKSSSGVSVVV